MLQNLKTRFGVSHILPVLALAPILGFVLLYLLESQYFIANLATELIGQGKLVEVFLRDDPALWSDPALARRAIDRLHESVSSRIMLLDAEHHLLASSHESDQGRIGEVIALNQFDAMPKDQIAWQIAESSHLHQRIVDVAVPVFDSNNTILGVVRLSQRVSGIIERVLPLRWFVVGALLLAITLATLLALFLARSLSLPLARLTQAVTGIQPYDLSKSVPETGPEEIRTLASSFNQMARRLNDAETEKRHLVASLVHELGTSLGGVKVAVQALQRGAGKDHDLVVELADGIRGQVDHLGLIVNDLSLLNETQQFELILRPQWIDPNDLIYNKCWAYLHLIKQKGITLIIAMDKDLPPFRADETRICQILGNLLHNAWKFTPATGRVTVTVTRQKFDHQPDHIRFQIADTGPGVAVEEQDKIFELFYRSQLVRSGYMGSGIGLALARRLAVAHGGTLTVQSQPEQGATFSLDLPLEARGSAD
ncbi:MAG: sensor histidine kinase [Anaerolineae bacterium]|nr:sensor histidine kinase [Anaerolineae bacterium]